MSTRLLDHAFKLLDSASSPQDFTLILHFSELPDAERLAAGAKSACERYRSTCKIETRIDIDQFVNRRINPKHPIRQMLGGASLATRFHHAAADGLSAALWLGHQLSVAYGHQPPASSAELSLRRPCDICAPQPIRVRHRLRSTLDTGGDTHRNKMLDHVQFSFVRLATSVQAGGRIHL
jgi:hypothetical protein